MPAYNLVGIGVGPFNLSTAALMAPIHTHSSIFLEKKDAFHWYPGMLLPHSFLQTSFLKDLVTSANPVSPYSFLAYLAAHKRFYRFLNAEYPFIERREFADYMEWVAKQLPNIVFNQEACQIETTPAGFTVHTQDSAYTAGNLVIATGIQPNVPDWAVGMLDENCIHAHYYMQKRPSVAGKHVVIVGGGQSGIEILLNLMDTETAPASITLLTRRQTLETLDDSPFANEFFTPDYVDAFFTAPHSKKRSMVHQQKLASDGISSGTLHELIQKLYACDFLDYPTIRPHILPKREVIEMRRENKRYILKACNHFNGAHETIHADVVLLTTGYQARLPECLNGIRTRLPFDEEGLPLLNRDFSIACDWPHGGKVYVQNMARFSHGIADPQLSLAAWRSATIINSILQEAHYYTNDACGTLQWSATNHPI